DSRAVRSAAVVRMEARTIFDPEAGVGAGAVDGVVVGDGAAFGASELPHAPSVSARAAATEMPEAILRVLMSPTCSESGHIVSHEFIGQRRVAAEAPRPAITTDQPFDQRVTMRPEFRGL